MKCPRCQTENQPVAAFCSGCGLAFAGAKRKNTISTPIGILIAVAAVCGLCGIVGGIGALFDKTKPQETAQINSNSNNVSLPASTPTPIPTPVPITELKSKTDELLKFEKNEYKSSDLAQFDKVMTPLKEIPKESKDYKQAQVLLKKLIDKSSRIGAEIVVLGEKPDETDLHLAFNHYLRSRLNDYDSSEYVSYTSARKVTIKGEPFWVSILTLRAKNALGAYLLKDVTMYIRNKEVVLADGL
jgi:hypothetical protein